MLFVLCSASCFLRIIYVSDMDIAHLLSLWHSITLFKQSKLPIHSSESGYFSHLQFSVLENNTFWNIFVYEPWCNTHIQRSGESQGPESPRIYTQLWNSWYRKFTCVNYTRFTSCPKWLCQYTPWLIVNENSHCLSSKLLRADLISAVGWYISYGCSFYFPGKLL